MRAAAGIAIAVLVSIAVGLAPVDAWTVITAPGGAARTQAVVLPPGNQPGAAVSPPNGSVVAVSWPANDAPVNGYVVRSYDAVTGAARPVGPACAGVLPTTSCSEAAVPNGRWTYAVVPARAAWRGPESPLSAAVLVDTVAPVPAISFPAAGVTYSSASWNAGCASRICGTATDAGGGVAAVSVSVRQGSGNYWNGTSFGSPTEVLLPASGTASWTLPFPGANFPASGAYTVRAVATDTVGNGGSVSRSFTIDITRPSPTAIVLVDANGSITPGTDEARITFSEPLNTTSICSSWSGPADQVLGGSGVVVSVVNGGLLGDNDVLTVTASGCTLHVGSLALGRDYVLFNSTFGGSTAATESRVHWTAATRTLTVHLGARLTGSNALLPAAAGTAAFTPDPAITDDVGNPVTTTAFSQSNVRF